MLSVQLLCLKCHEATADEPDIDHTGKQKEKPLFISGDSRAFRAVYFSTSVHNGKTCSCIN